MKDLSLGSIISSAAVFLAAGTVFPQSGWFQQQSPTSQSLRSVYFTGANIGTAVGDSGTILRTTDGGAHWTKQQSGTPAYLTSVFFADANTGVAVGGGGTIVRTTDGGTDWTNMASGTTNALNAVAFINADTGVAVGGNAILLTTDGGAHWANRDSDDIFNCVAFAGGAGTAIGNRLVLRTTDNGQTWAARDSFPISEHTPELYGVAFINADTGVAVGGVNNAGIRGAILTTTDGGAHWASHVETGTEYLYGATFVDSSTATSVGYGGAILRTTDGGATWARQSSGTQNTLLGVCFTGADTGTAVGNGGVIIRTTDGGGATGVAANPASLSPAVFTLAQNFPNPFKSTTTIPYFLPHSGAVNLEVRNLLGKRVATLVNQTEPAGEHFVSFNAADLPAGGYIVTARVGSYLQSKMMFVTE